MLAASPRFYATLAESHFVVARADLLIGGAVYADLSDLGVLTDGEVQVQNGAIQRTGSVQLTDQSGILQPRAPEDLLAPVGNEIRLWRGVVFADTRPPEPAQELVPIGTFRFVASKGKYPQIDLNCYDRAWVIAGNKLETPFSIAKGTNYITAITTILAQAWGGGLPTNFPTTDEVTPAMVIDAEADPWEVCRQLAANLGLRLYFDPWGVCTLTPEPTGDSPAVWTYDDARINNLGLVGLEVGWDASEAVNSIVAVGENSDNDQVYRGVARDTDPTSPTQWGGRFGRRNDFVRDEKITSYAQASARAKQELRKRLGIVQTVSVPSLINPCLECGDVVRVIDSRQGLDQKVMVDRFTVPLRSNATTTLERTRLMPAEAI